MGKVGIVAFVLLGLVAASGHCTTDYLYSGPDQRSAQYEGLRPFWHGFESQGNPSRDDPYRVKTFEVSGAALLNVTTPKGNIEIIASEEHEDVTVELYAEQGFALWSRSSNLDNYMINLFQRGNEIIASVEQKGKSSGWSDGVSFNIKIYTPQSASSELRTMGGHISLKGLKGEQKLRSSGGHLNLADLKGEVKAYTSGGNIDLTDISGSVLAYTKGGSIHADRVKGEMRLKTNAGNITGEELRGYIAASTSAGNIDVEMAHMERGLSLEALAGNVSARVPANTGYNVNMSGTSAEMDFSGNFSGQKSGNLIQGVINDGGININMSSKFGNTTLRLD